MASFQILWSSLIAHSSYSKLIKFATFKSRHSIACCARVSFSTKDPSSSFLLYNLVQSMKNFAKSYHHCLLNPFFQPQSNLNPILQFELAFATQVWRALSPLPWPPGGHLVSDKKWRMVEFPPRARTSVIQNSSSKKGFKFPLTLTTLLKKLLVKSGWNWLFTHKMPNVIPWILKHLKIFSVSWLN